MSNQHNLIKEENHKKASELTRDNVFLKAERDNQQKRVESGIYKGKGYKPSTRFENLEEWAKWFIQQLNEQIEKNSKKISNYLST